MCWEETKCHKAQGLRNPERGKYKIRLENINAKYCMLHMLFFFYHYILFWVKSLRFSDVLFSPNSNGISVLSLEAMVPKKLPEKEVSERE
jgi:hypothetical protein